MTKGERNITQKQSQTRPTKYKELASFSFLSGAGVCFLMLLPVYATHFWKTEYKRTKTHITKKWFIAHFSSFKLCQWNHSMCMSLAKWTHQLPFSNVFIPVHVILYHLLHRETWVNINNVTNARPKKHFKKTIVLCESFNAIIPLCQLWSWFNLLDQWNKSGWRKWKTALAPSSYHH